MENQRPDGTVNNIKTLHSEVPVLSNKPFYPSLELYLAGRCNIIGDILYDIIVPCFFMNNIQHHDALWCMQTVKRGALKGHQRRVQQGTTLILCYGGKKLPAYELCIKIQFPETFCWWEDLPPKTNQVKLFIGLLLFNCHWHHEKTLAPLELIWPGHMFLGVYMSWAGSQFPSEQMNSTTSLFPTSYLGICWLMWFCRL